MRRAGRILLAILIAVAAVPGWAQQWREHRPPGAGYRVELPGTPTPVVQRLQTPHGVVPYHGLSVIIGNRGFHASHTVYPPGVLQTHPQAAFDRARNAQLQGLPVREEQRLTIGDAPARRFVFDRDARSVVTLVVLRGQMLYQLMYAGPKGTDTSPDAERFLASFELLPP